MGEMYDIGLQVGLKLAEEIDRKHFQIPRFTHGT